MSAMAELDLLLNELNDARQAYDEAKERPNLVRVIATADHMSQAAQELHSTLLQALTS